ncbi:hypothetical protein GDO86_008078, partial [Hymenochirus boettgeri]
MVNEATNYLFNATKRRLFIKSVKILIPFTWTSKKNYEPRQRETYEKADIIIAKPALTYGDDPYTLQYGGCGEQGKHIHFTPNFLLKDNLISVYGPRGKVFVHEWAHLRWGVFDEYNRDKPYYISGNLTIEPTRCSTHVNGTNMVVARKGKTCEARKCKLNSDTNLYEKGCTFFPEKKQVANESIMYMQALPSVTQFCDNTNHNIEAPTLQNKMCNSKSTWDIIGTSRDIISSSPREYSNYPEPSFSLLQYRDRVVTLLIDVSGSMVSKNRASKVFQATDVFLTQIIETGSYVGVVEFSDYAFIISHLVQVLSTEDREKLKLLIPHNSTNSGSDICSGIRSALEVNKQHLNSKFGTEIILITDEPEYIATQPCIPEIKESGSIIHVIALGKYTTTQIEHLADMTGGLKYFVKDEINNDLIDALTGLSAQNGDVFQKTFQLESISSILRPKECLNGTVFIDKTVGNETFFVVTWHNSELAIILQNPRGKLYTKDQFVFNSSSKLSRLQIPGTAERGLWNYSLCNAWILTQAVGIIVTSKAANISVLPLHVNVHINTNSSKYPNVPILYASVNSGLLPVKGAKVTAFIDHEIQASVMLELLDNGAGADIIKGDGIYSKYFLNSPGNGRYKLKVRVQGTEDESRFAAPMSRALYIPGYVENNKIYVNIERPQENEDAQVSLGSFSRTASGGSFIISNVYEKATKDNYKPSKITDLEAQIRMNKFLLSWTATGDDLDEGEASRYDLRLSNNLRKLRDHFDRCAAIEISILPKPVGSRETYEFAPKNISVMNGTNLYFAVVAVDKSFQKSEISNIAQAVLLILP